MALSQKWYERKLKKYYSEHYGEYDEYVEWYVNPEINEFKFIVPQLGQRIKLTCYDNGEITEAKEDVDFDEIYSIVEFFTDGVDAVYEDFIIAIVGEPGFKMLRKSGCLELCGSNYGRNLYTLHKREKNYDFEWDTNHLQTGKWRY